jgi:hypothetical protein
MLQGSGRSPCILQPSQFLAAYSDYVKTHESVFEAHAIEQFLGGALDARPFAAFDQGFKGINSVFSAAHFDHHQFEPVVAHHVEFAAAATPVARHHIHTGSFKASNRSVFGLPAAQMAPGDDRFPDWCKTQTMFRTRTYLPQRGEVLWCWVACMLFETVAGKALGKLPHMGIAVFFGDNRGGTNTIDFGITFDHRLSRATEFGVGVSIDIGKFNAFTTSLLECRHRTAHRHESGFEDIQRIDLMGLAAPKGVWHLGGFKLGDKRTAFGRS